MPNDKKSPVQSQPSVEGEILSEEDKKKLPPDVVRRIVTLSQSYEGPLPPAGEFAKYEKVHKGAANRIIGMAEKALDAEVKASWWNNITVFWSMIASRCLLYLLVIVALVLILNGKDVAGLLTGIVPAIQILSNIDFRKKGNQTPTQTTQVKNTRQPKKKNSRKAKK